MQPKDNNNGIVHWQHQRLSYFLIASAFLIAAFVQLVGADANNTLVSADRLLFLVHAVAGLGVVVSVGYSFMNFCECRKHQLELAHTWIIPVVFLLFWLITWYHVTHAWFSFLVFVASILGCLIYLNRHAIVSRLRSIHATLRHHK